MQETAILIYNLNYVFIFHFCQTEYAPFDQNILSYTE